MDYEIRNERSGEILSTKAKMADAPLTRMRGLLGRKSMPFGEAIILRPASSIHTLFMRFPIDVVYVDADNKVVKTVSNLVPYRFSSGRKARATIETAAGVLAGLDIQPGDQLVFTPVSQH